MLRSILLLVLTTWLSQATLAQTCANVVNYTSPCEPFNPAICDAGILNANLAVDNDPSTFAILEVSPFSLDAATLGLGFSTPVQAGTIIEILFRSADKKLTQDLIDGLTVKVLDQNGVVILEELGLNLLDLQNVPGQFGLIKASFLTPMSPYSIAGVEIQLNSINDLGQRLFIYEVCAKTNCLLSNIQSIGTNILAFNLSNLLDGDNTNFAFLSLPIGILNDAELVLNLDQPVEKDAFVGLEIAGMSLGLTQALLSNIQLELLDGAGNILAIKNGFQLTELIEVSANPGNFIIGLNVINQSQPISSIRIKLSPILGLLTDLAIFDIITSPLSKGIPMTVFPNSGVLCESGSVTLDPENGWSNYVWSNGDTGRSLQVTEPGLYSVTAVDSWGCQGHGSFLVEVSNIIAQLDSSNSQTSNCEGEGNGSGILSLNILNGSGAFSVQWSNGDTGTTIANLDAGVYTATITDMVTGCLMTQQFGVSDKNGPEVKTYQRNAQCGAQDGEVANQATGDGPFLYEWGHTSNVGPVATNLGPGPYWSTTSDRHGCKTVREHRITEEGDFKLSANITNSACLGATGAIDLEVGVPGDFTYTWNTGDTTQDISNLAAGIYVVEVKDLTGCIDSGFFAVSDDGGPQVTLIDQRNVSCFGAADGRLEISVPAGSVILWDDNSASAIRENLSPGRYSVQVIGAPIPCNSFRVYEIKGPEPLLALGVPNDDCTNTLAADGGVEVNVFGGTPPYQYFWSNGDTTKNLENVFSGMYTLAVVDSNGCVDSVEFMVGQQVCSNENGVFVSEFVSPNGDGSNDHWIIEGLDNFDRNQVVVFDRYGQVVFEMEDYQEDFKGEHQRIGNQLAPGTYYYKLLLFNGDEETEVRGFFTLRFE